MRRINYTRTLGDDPFTVGCYYIERPYSDAAILDSIKMRVLQCSSGGIEADLATFVKPQSDVNAEFLRDYPNILRGAPSEWQLILFQVKAACVILEYGHTTTKRIERIKLSLSDRPDTSLQLEFEVPHVYVIPYTAYQVRLECNRRDRNQPIRHKAVVTETLNYPPSQKQRNLFTFDSDHPNLCFVSEYVDM